MSMRTLPLLFINLGGEMIYILDQRLRAQNTSDDRSQNGTWSADDRRRVMNDLVGTMFNKDFMEELLKPQELYSHRALRSVITRLAHSSIMRLNPASMDRLYELMVMAFKYQLLLCPRPRDLLLITYNHMDRVREFVRETASVANRVDETQRKIIEVYSHLPQGELQLLRQTLLVFFQDMHVRVSLFLSDKKQNPNGHFVIPTTGPVPYGTEVPGLIRMFNRKGRELSRKEFPSGGSFRRSLGAGSFEMFGDRVTRLGNNMYNVTQGEDTSSSNGSSQKDTSAPNPLATEELNLLASLMGALEVRNHGPVGMETGFRVNLFATDLEEDEAGTPEETEVMNIQATQANTELARIAGQFAEDSSQDQDPISTGDDLLAMMDDL